MCISGLLLLVMAANDGQTQALSTGDICVCLLWWDLWLVCLWDMVGTGGVLEGLAFLGLTDTPRVQLNLLFLSSFPVPYSVFFSIFSPSRNVA